MDLDAFISRLLGEDELVYMVIPPGLKVHFGENKVLRLRSMYGFFGQRPLNYYKLAQEVYTRAGFEAVSGTGRLMRFFCALREQYQRRAKDCVN